MAAVASAAVLLALGILADGCPAPTLPLPPPEAKATPPDAQGMVSVQGQALEQAFVACLNERAEYGVIVKSDEEGMFALRIEAVVGDDLTVWQILGSERGRFTPVTVPAPE